MYDHLVNLMNRRVQQIGHDIGYLKFDPSTPKNKFNESKVKRYLPPVPMKAVLVWHPTEEKIQEFGLDRENVEILFRIPTTQFTEAGITPDINDKVSLNGEEYFIIGLDSGGWVNNQPIFTVLACGRESENRGK